MDLLQLEHFLAVVEERTFTRAAERVCRTQPAVSQSIKKLEDEIGAPLFARDVHDVSLTEAGTVLVELRAPHGRARATMRCATSGASKTLKTRHADDRRARIRRRLPAAGAAASLPGSSFPDIKVGIYRSRLARHSAPGSGSRGRRRVRQGRAGVPRAAVRSSVHADEMVLVASPGPSAGARGRRPRPRPRRRSSSSLHHLCSTTEQKILQLFEQHATPCRIVAELWSFENIKTFVQAEVGLAIVPRVTVADRSSGTGKLVRRFRVSELPMPRRTLMIYREQGYLSRAGARTHQIVRSFNWDGRGGS
mgnify:CR=1 FL=1